MASNFAGRLALDFRIGVNSVIAVGFVIQCTFGELIIRFFQNPLTICPPQCAADVFSNGSSAAVRGQKFFLAFLPSCVFASDLNRL